jgi:hypothetical protein
VLANVACPLSRIHAADAFGFTSSRRCVTMVVGCSTLSAPVGAAAGTLTRWLNMKPKVAILAVLLGLVVCWVVGLGCYPLVTWSPLNCRHEDIDINTGRIRHQRFLLGICVSEHVEDSPISRELGIADAAPDWRRANTFSPCVGYSPHYVFHSGINQTRKLERIWQLAVFTPGARKQISLEVLRLWQTGQCDDAAKPYIDALDTLAIDRESTEPSITIGDLPDA